jgi:hypothetical protein
MPLMGAGRTGEPQANQRLTVAQAAASLGITEGAVRSRIKRGTLTTTKEGGAVFVLLGDGTSQANQPTNTDVPDDQFVAQLLDRVASLERQLERREDETERLHQIIGGLAQANAEQARTIRAIEAPREAGEAEDAETVEEEPEAPVSPGPTETPTPAPEEIQTPTQRPQGGGLRGLRRRILGW